MTLSVFQRGYVGIGSQPMKARLLFETPRFVLTSVFESIMKRILILAALLWLGVWKSAAGDKPNFVIFIADDFSYCDLHCWGSPDARTPNLDRLASEGMKLTRCYTPAPVCSPTRMALYSGLFPVKNGGYPN